MNMSFLARISNLYKRYTFNSGNYWENRYRLGGNSGDGSYNELAIFKAEVINNIISQDNIEHVIEFGCGDGEQLKLLNIKKYYGLDISKKAIDICKRLHINDKGKVFKQYKDHMNEKADLILSLDVIYHLIEDSVYNDYMNNLFSSSLKKVIIYSSNYDSSNEIVEVLHVKHRKFTDWIDRFKPEFKLVKKIPNQFPYNQQKHSGSLADFYIYEKI